MEAHVRDGIPSFAIVGLADRACQEARERVRSGISAAELTFPPGRITVNLAPAELRKEGSGFDLPIALALLAASQQLPRSALERTAAVGETDDGEARDSVADMRLDVDPARLEADERMRDRACKHTSRLGGEC